MKYPIFLFLLIGNLKLAAQTPLSIPTKNHCSYSGTAWEDELYRFEDNDQVKLWVKEIVDISGAEQNFILIQTNVENVAAIVDNGQRYLFYSLDFIQKAKPIDVYGALAHEIGHHVNGHTLNEDRRQVEESEADFFMGYTLSKKNFSKSLIEAFLQKLPSSHAISLAIRRKVIFDGFNKADRFIQINGLQFENDPKLLDLTLPTFVFHACYGTSDIAKARFSRFRTLGSVNEHLQSALNQRGYTQRTYFSVKNGFALVTQMEQYNATDGTSRNDRTRWLDYPARDNFSSLMDYCTAILLPNKGYFRLFVFVVTDTPFKSNNERVSKSEATAWLGQGMNRLPKALANAAYTEGYDVSVLVYEFEVPESNHVAKQICPVPRFDVQKHLTQAGIRF